MPQNFHNLHFPQMKRVKQISYAHCGPAVVKMLLSFQGIKVNQRELAAAAGITHTIKTYGMTIPQMIVAVNQVAPSLQFWYKDNTTLKQLQDIVSIFKHPVGVEWQGVFGEYADEDNGHYAIITYADVANNMVLLADPFGPFSGTDRRFGILEFDRRWWDTNEITSPDTDKKEKVLDYHMMFIVTQKSATFPQELGMVQG